MKVKSTFEDYGSNAYHMHIFCSYKNIQGLSKEHAFSRSMIKNERGNLCTNLKIKS